MHSSSIGIRWPVLDEYVRLSGWTYAKLAKEFKYSHASISQWKKRGNIPIPVLKSLCEFLKINPEQVLNAPKKTQETPESKLNELKARFSVHHLDETGIRRLQEITQRTRDLAILIDSICPNNKDKNHALTLLKGVQMYANSSISQEYPYNEI